MNLEAVIGWVWRCTWRPWSCELGGHNRASLEIHLEAVIEWVWRCNWRPWSSEIGGVLEGGQSGGGSSGGRRDGSWDCIHWLTRKCLNVENWVQHGLSRDERLTWERETDDLGMMQYMVYVGLSVCCTQCMLYSESAVLGVCCTWCMLYSLSAVLGVCCTQCMLYSVLTLDHGKER